jgi:hypothetical protein
MPDIQIHIGPKPTAEGDKGPQIIIGFTSESFSQAVFLDAPSDPQDAVKAADALYKGYLDACATAVKEWNTKASDAD